MSLGGLGQWFIAFVFTQCIEVPLSVRVTNRWSVSVLASCITHPVVWFAFPALWPVRWSYGSMIVACEVFAVLTEAVWFRINGVRRALWLSFVVNGASAIGGLLLRQMFGWP